MRINIVFDEHCTEWVNNMTYNKEFVKHQMNYIETIFEARGYIYENQIYEQLGKGWNPYRVNHVARVMDHVLYTHVVEENNTIIIRIERVKIN